MEKIRKTKYQNLKRKFIKMYKCEVKLFNRMLGIR